MEHLAIVASDGSSRPARVKATEDLDRGVVVAAVRRGRQVDHRRSSPTTGPSIRRASTLAANRVDTMFQPPVVVSSPSMAPACARSRCRAATPSRPRSTRSTASHALVQLTHQNDALFSELQLGTVEEVSAKSKDGTEVHGLLTKPAGYVAGTKIPMLLRIHGGPNGQDQHSFSFERQWFAANGYAVLAVNYRGSAGRGSKFSKAIAADWGHYEVDDLQAMVDQVVKMGVADPNKLGVGGWSYGGILTDYMIASDTRFKAATSGAGTAFTVAFYGTDQYIIQYDFEIGPPWDPEGVGDLPEDLVSVPPRRSHQDADALPRRREGLQRAGAGRAADVSGAAQPRHRHAADDLSEREPRHQPPELRPRSLRALPGVVRQSTSTGRNR